MTHNPTPYLPNPNPGHLPEDVPSACHQAVQEARALSIAGKQRAPYTGQPDLQAMRAHALGFKRPAAGMDSCPGHSVQSMGTAHALHSQGAEHGHSSCTRRVQSMDTALALRGCRAWAQLLHCTHRVQSMDTALALQKPYAVSASAISQELEHTHAPVRLLHHTHEQAGRDLLPCQNIAPGNPCNCIAPGNPCQCIAPGNLCQCIAPGNPCDCIAPGNLCQCIAPGNLCQCIAPGNPCPCIASGNPYHEALGWEWNVIWGMRHLTYGVHMGTWGSLHLVQKGPEVG